jgi:hypothetical protein
MSYLETSGVENLDCSHRSKAVSTHYFGFVYSRFGSIKRNGSYYMTIGHICESDWRQEADSLLPKTDRCKMMGTTREPIPRGCCDSQRLRLRYETRQLFLRPASRIEEN